MRAKAEFARVFESGVRRAEPALALHWLADPAPPRLGLAVSRKVDPRAVGRNRIKRSLREAFRRRRADLAPGAYVVVARQAAAALDNRALVETFQRLLARIGALPPPPPGRHNARGRDACAIRHALPIRRAGPRVRLSPLVRRHRTR